MSRFLLRRLAQMIPIILGISIVVFGLTRLAPGDPFKMLLNPRTPASYAEQRRKDLGLDKSIPVQYLIWLKETVTGNLGYSYHYSKPVAEMIGERLPNTLLLTGTAFLLAFLISIPVGVISAVRQYSVLDYVLSFGAFVGISLPSFFTALLAIYLFASKWRIFPIAGMVTPGVPFQIGDLLYHLMLPALVLGVRDMAVYTRFARSSMLEVIRQDYVRTARSKGLAQRLVVFKHALRNALIPVITLLGFSLPELFAGAVIMEQVFTWPGMGLMSISAVVQRDYPVLMTVNLLFALMVLVGSLLADVLYAVVDPRIRYS